MPPLRVRPADIRALQAFFLRAIAKQRDVADIFLTDEAVRALESYSYPLNITELQTMVERAVAQVGGLGGLGVRAEKQQLWGDWRLVKRGMLGACPAAGDLSCLRQQQPQYACLPCCCLQSAAAGNAVTDDVFWFARQVQHCTPVPASDYTCS